MTPLRKIKPSPTSSFEGDISQIRERLAKVEIKLAETNAVVTTSHSLLKDVILPLLQPKPPPLNGNRTFAAVLKAGVDFMKTPPGIALSIIAVLQWMLWAGISMRDFFAFIENLADIFA